MLLLLRSEIQEMKQVFNLLIASTFVLSIASCGGKKEATVEQSATETQPKAEAISDPHSFANIHEVYAKHLHLNVNVDFEQQKLIGSVTYDIVFVKPVTEMIFDTRSLRVDSVLLDGEVKTDFQFGEYDELLGTPLHVTVTPATKKVQIFYQTGDSWALQWLTPEQTSGKKSPYLFTQGQAILTRTWIPCQDSPLLRITYSADIQVPSNLLAVMSANNPRDRNPKGRYSFEMKQPIPVYLMALAVGDLVFEPIGKRTGVYSEPDMVKACAYELNDMERMLEAAEKLYGEYLWERYDVIVLPPSFPFGGMENPRLTFATPTIIAGDRSLVSLIAHELAHSWSGNLVTNATWSDFWLNEGFTVYFENRIMEELYGKEYSDMLLLLAEQDLKAEIQGMVSGGREKDTYLKLRLADRDPDDGMNAITYDKGAFFLRMLEHTAGRERFDSFLSQYFNDYRFTNVTTEDFVSYLDKHLLKKYNLSVNVDEWVYGPGLPASHVPIVSDKFKKVEIAVALFHKGTSAKDIFNADWSTHERIHFIRNLQTDINIAQLKEIDGVFGFSKSGNAEILTAWFVVSINRGYLDNRKELESFLMRVGRRKFLKPIYEALSKTEEGLAFARAVYAKARPNYHSVSTGTIDKLLGLPA